MASRTLFLGVGEHMNYSNIKYNDIANGVGIRTSLFVSGCTHRCPGCFNEETWEFSDGKAFDKEVEQKIIASLKQGHVDGISLLGGEPMEPQNQRGLVEFVEKVKTEFPEKSIWCYTGYLFDTDLQPGGRAFTEVTERLMNCFSIIVDGRFELEYADISLRFRGSSNQRIIDVLKSMKKSRTILAENMYEQRR